MPGYNNNNNQIKDYGPRPMVVNINRFTRLNSFFRTSLWTGNYFQLTLMSIMRGEEIGLEMHPELDQFLKIESGTGIVKMGNAKNNLTLTQRVDAGYAIVIPAGTWHNLINTGNTPIKLYSIYAPPEHPFGTVHRTKRESDNAEHD